MRKFVAFVALLCAVMISSTTSAEMQPVQLYDQNIFTLTQKLQELGIKVWNMKYQTTKYYSGYNANFGDNPNNQLAFLVNDDGAVAVMIITTQFDDTEEYIAYSKGYQAGEIWAAMLIIVGLTEKDIKKLAEEYYFSIPKPILSSHKYRKEFSSYSMKTRRLIVTEIFVEEILHGIGEIKIFMRALV